MPSSKPEWADQRALVLLGHIILGSHFNNKQLRLLCSPDVTPVHAKAISTRLATNTDCSEKVAVARLNLHTSGNIAQITQWRIKGCQID